MAWSGGCAARRGIPLAGGGRWQTQWRGRRSDFRRRPRHGLRVLCGLARRSHARAWAALPLGQRHGRGLPRFSESDFVTRLEYTGAAEQRTHGVARLGADVQPVIRAGGIHLQRIFLAWGVLADDLDETAIARALAVGDHDTVDRGVFPPDPAETNANHARAPVLMKIPGSSRPRRIRGAPGRTELQT